MKDKAMSIGRWAEMWDIPVWKAHIRLISLQEDGLAEQFNIEKDGKLIVLYAMNTKAKKLETI